MIVDCAAYVDGHRVAGPLRLDQVAEWRAKPDAWVWLGLRMPSAAEAARVSEVFGLHPLASEDAMAAHDLPKVEAIGSTLLLVLRTAHYQAAQREVRLGELAVLCGDRFVITVRHGQASPLERVRQTLEADASAWPAARASPSTPSSTGWSTTTGPCSRRSTGR